MTNMNKIIYAGLALLLCASCSKDNGTEFRSMPDAKISLQLQASGANKKSALKADTKAGADANELPGEAYINNITALVFNEDGSELLTPYYTETSSTEGTLTLTDIPAKAGKAMIVLVGNAGSGAFANVTSYAGFEAVLCQLASQAQDNLTMSSQVIETQQPLVAGDENYIGYETMGANNINGISTPLELTRLAARLDIVNANTNFTRSIMSGRTVTIESISVGNQKTASHFFSRDYWGEVVAAGNLATSGAATLNLAVDNNTSLGRIAYSHYVMENDGSESPTELLITATLSARAPYLAETRTFGAVINENGLAKYGHNYVKRNYVYKIALTFKDDNFEGDVEEEVPVPPVPPIIYGAVDVTLSVAEWNTEEIDVPGVEN